MEKKFHNRLQADGEKVKGLFGEFKKFIARGNVLDMAVGVIVGSAIVKNGRAVWRPCGTSHGSLCP